MKRVPNVETMEWLHQVHSEDISNPQVVDVCGVVRGIVAKEDFLEIRLEDGAGFLENVILSDNDISELDFEVGDVIALEVVVSSIGSKKSIIVFQEKDLTPVFKHIAKKDYPESIKKLYS